MSDENAVGDSQSQGSQRSQPSQSQEPRGAKPWKLAGGTMRVLSHGKKKPIDNYTVLQLEFTFDCDNRPKKVG